MIKLFKYFRKRDVLMIILSLLFIVLSVFLDLKIPEYMSIVTRLVQTEGSKISDIWLNGGYMLLSALGSLLATVIVSFFAAKVGSSIAKNLRSELFNKVDSFSMAEINSFSTPSLITRSTNDVTQVQMVTTLGIMMLLKAPIMAVWALIKIANKGFEWTMATFIAVIILSVILGLILLFVIPKFKKMQVLTDDLNKVTREHLSGLAVVRAYNAEDYQQAKFEQVNTNLTKTKLYTSRTMSTIQPTMMFMMSGLSLAIYWIGAFLISNALPLDRLTLFSNMVVFSSYSIQVLMSFMMITMLFVLLPRAQVSAKRINEVLDTYPTILDGDINSNPFEGTIEFKHVSFKYPDAEECVLKDISFKIEKGQTAAFIGSTGSGKSTILNLVLRFYDVTEGEILVDGINIKDYELHALYERLGYIPQSAVMFDGNVLSNVAFGENLEDINKEKATKAIKIAQSEDFVLNMNDTYHGAISRGGTNLSGGQKQRLSIARAIYKEPSIYLFDDSFSALDYKTDRILRTTLKRHENKTNLIVAQRVGTILDSDQIIVLDSGRIVGIGKHDELMKSSTVYQEIAYSQLSREEL